MAGSLPEGYRQIRHGAATAVAKDALVDAVMAALREHGTLHAFAAAHPGRRPLQGRGTAYAIHLASSPAVVRHFHRGGWMAPLLRDRYAKHGDPRPLRELRLAALARHRGIPTPEPLAAVVYPAGVFYRGDLATAEVSGARSLADLTAGPAAASAEERLAAWAAAGRTIRLAMDRGLVHADLNLRNVLVAPGDREGERVFLIDLDRCRLVDHVPATVQSRMIDRFHRSRRKLEEAAGMHAATDALAAFHEGLRG